MLSPQKLLKVQRVASVENICRERGYRPQGLSGGRPFTNVGETGLLNSGAWWLVDALARMTNHRKMIRSGNMDEF